jgi:hypothetical protein
VIRFEPRSKPDGFAERVERRGTTWLAANAMGRPPPHWLEFRSHLTEAFGSLCAYGAMYEPVGTVGLAKKAPVIAAAIKKQATARE